jgi:predicted LPLAT superfamily acyltransferase
VSAPARWEQLTEIGTARGLRLGAWVHRHLGRGPVQAGLRPAMAYYSLRNRAGRRASQRYLARVAAIPAGRAHLPRDPDSLLVMRHFYEIAVQVYDRMLAWSGAIDAIDLSHDGTERVLELSRERQGALLLGAHLGSLELLGFLARRYDLRFNVVTYYDNAERINAFLESHGKSQVRLIRLDPSSVRAAFDIRASLERGEFVVMLADRLPPGPRVRSAHASFLGGAARFPLSPFLLATVLGYPVYLAVCVRTGEARYTSITRPLAPGQRPPRGEREKVARELLARYASNLEEICLRYPLQWFNFYDFWEEEAP